MAEGLIAALITQHHQRILDNWIQQQMAALSGRGTIREGELRAQSAEFLTQLRVATASGVEEFDQPVFDPIRGMLSSMSRSRAQQGFTPTETAAFILSLRQVLFTTLRDTGGDQVLTAEFWSINEIIDRLAIYTMDEFLRGREEVISRQQQELLELSTPVVELWEGVLALPLIGTLDSGRTQVVMESLLQKIVETGAPMAIIDITGVPYVDTLVAQHLLKTVAASRLMGADCIISGIRPQIAQTIVHLGVDLKDVMTKSTLSEAFRVALARVGARVVKD